MGFFLRFLLKRKKKVIIENYFNFKNNVRLGLFFRFEKIFDKSNFYSTKLNENKKKNHFKRKFVLKKFNFSNKFEKNLIDEFRNHVPHYLIENFEFLLGNVKSIKIKSNYIIS